MPARIEVSTYNPLPHQKEFHSSDARFRLYLGGFGSGKTLAGVWESIDVSMAWPNNEGLVLRKTYRELADTTQRTFFDVCPPALIKTYSKKDETVTLVNGSRILFRSLDDENKLRSLNLGWWFIDEASEINNEDVPKMLSGRLRRVGVPWKGAWMTTNPPHLEHWLYSWFVRNPGYDQTLKKDYFFVRATSYDNPHLPPDYAESLAREYSPQWVRRFLLGEFGNITPGTAVFENWNDSIHVQDKLTWVPDRPIIRGWDFGFNVPCVLYAQLGPDRTLRVLQEKMGRRVLFHKFRDRVLLESSIDYPGASFIDVGDPAGRQHSDKDDRTNIDLLKEVGINLVTRRYGKKRVIELVDQKLAMIRRDRKDDSVHPVIQVDRKGCPVLIEGFSGGYCWPKGKDGKMTREVPLEDGYYEHVHDALQYIVSSMFLGGSVMGSGMRTAAPSFWNV